MCSGRQRSRCGTATFLGHTLRANFLADRASACRSHYDIWPWPCRQLLTAAIFAVTEAEAEAAVIRVVFEQQGELSAAIELRRLFPGMTDNTQARECARTIAGWK